MKTLIGTILLIVGTMAFSTGAYATEDSVCSVGESLVVSKSSSSARGSIYDLAGHSTQECVPDED